MSLCFVSPLASAEPQGITGRTSTESLGCGFCHGSANTGTTVSLEGIAGPITMAPGETRQFTIVVAHEGQVVAGVDVAVRTSPTGLTNVGTLEAVSGGGTHVVGQEITHNMPRTMQEGVAKFVFSYTAPLTEGTYYMQAIGNACNGNGVDGAGDFWNWMKPVQVTVSRQTAVAEFDSDPWHVELVADLNGNVLRTDIPFRDLSTLPSGVYAIMIGDGRNTRRRLLSIAH